MVTSRKSRPARKAPAKKAAAKKSTGTPPAKKAAAPKSAATRPVTRKGASRTGAAKRVAAPAAKKAPAPVARKAAPKKAVPVARTAALAPAFPAPDAGIDPDFLMVKQVLDGLNAETGNNGAGAEADVVAFRNDPGGASVPLFARVSSLDIRRWFAGVPERPNKVERDRVWISVRKSLGKDNPGTNPDNWDGSSEVIELGGIAREAP